MKKNKKMLIVFIVIIFIIGCITIGIILMNNNDRINNQEKSKENILLKEDLNFEINSELKLLSLVSENNKVKIINKDEIIDTSILGTKEINIKYEINGKEKNQTIKITIVDTKVPVIEYIKELSTTKGTKIDLLKEVKVSDNSKEEIKATIEGNYDFNKVGKYSLKYIAIDSSKNKAEKEFTLKVYEEKATSSTHKTSSKNNKSSTKKKTTTKQNNSKPENKPIVETNPNEFYKPLPLYSFTDKNNFENNRAVDVWRVSYSGFFSYPKFGLDGKVESFEVDYFATPANADFTIEHVKSKLKKPTLEEANRLISEQGVSVRFDGGTYYVVVGNK